jgi:hypothetical protein
LFPGHPFIRRYLQNQWVDWLIDWLVGWCIDH